MNFVGTRAKRMRLRQRGLTEWIAMQKPRTIARLFRERPDLLPLGWLAAQVVKADPDA